MPRVLSQTTIDRLARDYGVLIGIMPDRHCWRFLTSEGQNAHEIKSDEINNTILDLQDAGYEVFNYYNRGQRSGQWSPLEGDQVWVLRRPWRKKNDKGEWERLPITE